MTTLALCMIVKNEERWLAQCLKSVEGLVDEICILDTGSTDQTIEIAKSFGAKVTQAPWEDSFAKARNRAIELSQCDWILMLDADEVLEKSSHVTIKEIIKNPKSPMYSLNQTTYVKETTIQDSQPNNLKVAEAIGYPAYYESQLIRLFKNDPKIRFHGVVHEHAKHDDNIPPCDSFVRIHHYGKYSTASVNAQKEALYLKLGLDKCTQHPDNYYFWYELGVQYADMGQNNKAIDALNQSLALNPNYFGTHNVLAAIANRNREFDKAVKHYLKVLELNPKAPEPYFTLPTLFIELGQLETATNIIKMAEPYFSNHPTFYVNKACVELACGNWNGAISSCNQAIAINSDDQLAWLNRAIAKIKMKKIDEALLDLDIAFTKNGDQKLDVLKKMMECHLAKKDYSASLEDIKQSLELSQNPATTAELIYSQAVTYYFMDRKQDCIAALDRIDTSCLNPNQLKNISAFSQKVKQHTEERNSHALTI